MSLQFLATDDVRHDVTNHVLFVTVDRPEKRNPLSLGVLERLREIFVARAIDPQIRLAVVTGAGPKAFASGGDLIELSRYRSPEEAEAFSRHGKAALDAIRLFPMPVIALLNGVALGGGAELALACDLRFASSTASIGFIHGRLCISPAWGGGADLVRIVGPARALSLMTSAAILNAPEAQTIGLLDHVCPPDSSLDEWFAVQLSGIRNQPRQVLRAYKSILISSRKADVSPTDDSETHHFCEAWCHEDHWNAVAQFNGGMR